jgi:hypothetical protein
MGPVSRAGIDITVSSLAVVRIGLPEWNGFCITSTVLGWFFASMRKER